MNLRFLGKLKISSNEFIIYLLYIYFLIKLIIYIIACAHEARVRMLYIKWGTSLSTSLVVSGGRVAESYGSSEVMSEGAPEPISEFAAVHIVHALDQFSACPRRQCRFTFRVFAKLEYFGLSFQ